MVRNGYEGLVPRIRVRLHGGVPSAGPLLRTALLDGLVATEERAEPVDEVGHRDIDLRQVRSGERG